MFGTKQVSIIAIAHKQLTVYEIELLKLLGYIPPVLDKRKYSTAAEVHCE